MERRGQPRFETKLRVLSEPDEGSGLLVDLSRSGAFVAKPSKLPAVGCTVRLRVDTPGGTNHLVGFVVRYGREGFAISFDARDAATRRGIERLIELAAEPD